MADLAAPAGAVPAGARAVGNGSPQRGHVGRTPEIGSAIRVLQ
jgi:hypothetical protein